jgi:hypothetical protein
MSYEGTICPCGDKKLGSTMLCDGCFSTFEQHSAMTDFRNDKLHTDIRRNAAMILLTLAGGRKTRRV